MNAIKCLFAKNLGILLNAGFPAAYDGLGPRIGPVSFLLTTNRNVVDRWQVSISGGSIRDNPFYPVRRRQLSQG